MNCPLCLSDGVDGARLPSLGKAIVNTAAAYPSSGHVAELSFVTSPISGLYQSTFSFAAYSHPVRATGLCWSGFSHLRYEVVEMSDAIAT